MTTSDVQGAADLPLSPAALDSARAHVRARVRQALERLTEACAALEAIEECPLPVELLQVVEVELCGAGANPDDAILWIAEWWVRPHDGLGGQRPAEAWKTLAERSAVRIHLARSMVAEEGGA